jgi:hypothetical protein
MKERQRLRRVAIGLRAAGLALIGTSITAALLRSGAGAALAQPAIAMRQMVAQVMPVPGLGTPLPEAPISPTPSAAPSATPAPRPTAMPKPSVARGGPLTFSLSGNLSFGERSFLSTRGDPSTPEGLLTSSQTLASNNVGLLVQMQRRTGATTLSMGVPLGVASSQRTNVGQVQAGYYTPKFGLQYMPQPLTALGGVPLGSTLGGFSLVLPLHGGDVSLYQGNGTVDLGAGARIYGVRARSLLGRSLVELGLVRAAREDGLASTDSLVAGFASDNGNLNQLFEGAIQRRHEDGAADSGANAYQYRLDYGSSTVYSTLSFRHVTDGFSSVGSGTVSADNQISTGFRTGPIAVQEIFETSGSGDQAARSRQGTFSIFRQFGERHPVGTMWTFSEGRSENTFGTTWLGSAGSQFQTNFGDMSALLGVQASRSTSSTSSPLTSFTYQGMFQKPLGSYIAQFQYNNSRQVSDGLFTKIAQSNLSITREWGLTSLTLADTLTRTRTLASDSLQTAPLLTLARRLSPALTLALNYGLQTTRDSLNPGSNGRSRIFNLQVTAPFAIGSGLVQGRANPNLPATISGSVINDVANQGPFTSAVSNGVGNVMVVLDNTQVQRTDLSGRFQFNFVTPGRHTVQVDLASLPRGVTPDQPIASIDVQGGQQGQVYFRIGTYGGVQGHVMGRDSNGQPQPISGVVLTIDKGALLTTTDAQGIYGFGRLDAGTHIVSVQPQSLPAMAAMPEAMTTQKVVVRDGEIATLDFIASPLGSIAGTIVFDPSLAPDHSGPVMNAYVVAEPGDYAAISNDDGTFLLDNIPAGTYTLDIDPETVPADTGSAGPQSITLGPDGHIQGIQFVVGRKQKTVVFSLKSEVQAVAANMSLRESLLPPGGATEISVDGDGRARSVVATAFDKRIELTYDKKRKKWVGLLIVPLDATPGNVTILADVDAAQKATASADLKIDPALPVATFSMTPHRPMRGQYVQARARFLADVHPGDRIRWLDGQLTKLGSPLTGRVYEFTVKISVQPMRGLLLTKQGQLPIILR